MKLKSIILLVLFFVSLNYVPVAFGSSITTMEITMNIFSDIKIKNKIDLGSMSVNDAKTIEIFDVLTPSNESINITITSFSGDGKANYRLFCPAGSSCANGVTLNENEKKSINIDTTGKYNLQIVGVDSGHKNLTATIEHSNNLNITRY